MTYNRKIKAFTLIELLVVVTIIALLVSILMPALSRAKQQARTIVCQSNIRQLVMANMGYAVENSDRYVLAAENITPDNLKRWHGERDDINSPFEPLRSPLKKYLGNGEVKICPEFRRYNKKAGQTENFEAGCGGYGYNDQYIGGRYDIKGSPQDCNTSARSSEVKRPSQTVMFSDAADGNADDSEHIYNEYSFIHPPIWPDMLLYIDYMPPENLPRPEPNIHFRHTNKANAAWADGHVTSEVMADSSNLPLDKSEINLGWFGPLNNNSIFDLK